MNAATISAASSIGFDVPMLRIPGALDCLSGTPYAPGCWRVDRTVQIKCAAPRMSQPLLKLHPLPSRPAIAALRNYRTSADGLAKRRVRPLPPLDLRTGGMTRKAADGCARSRGSRSSSKVELDGAVEKWQHFTSANALARRYFSLGCLQSTRAANRTEVERYCRFSPGGFRIGSAARHRAQARGCQGEHQADPQQQIGLGFGARYAVGDALSRRLLGPCVGGGALEIASGQRAYARSRCLADIKLVRRAAQ